jgi:FkbM family methyltransferase
MLIDKEIVKNIIQVYRINVTGIFHIGAHNCEEKPFYNNYLNVADNNIIWIDAMEDKVLQCLKNGIPNVYQAIITDKDDQDIEFNVANNGESSSVLKMKTHIDKYPQIHFIDKIEGKTTKIDTFMKKNNINPQKFTFWNLDIQGAELMALKGGTNAIQYAKIIYLEVNVDELYKDCARIDEIDEWLGMHNFVRIYTYMTDVGWGDAIYINSDMIYTKQYKSVTIETKNK